MSESKFHKKSMTCIVCPVGCRLEVEMTDGGKIVSVSGNTCKRGERYAHDEILHPVRTLTTTIRLTGAEERLVPVKTDAPIPKEALFEAMELARSLKAAAPVHAGDVVMRNFIAEGVNLVICKDVESI